LTEPWTYTFTDATFVEGAAFGGVRFAGWAGFSNEQFDWNGTFAAATFAHGVPVEVVHLQVKA
jgi:hypothetical protein